jgi:hypothetical protein
MSSTIFLKTSWRFSKKILIVVLTGLLLLSVPLAAQESFHDEWKWEAITHSPVQEQKKENTETKYADLVGDYKFVLEGEEMLIKLYIQDGVLYGEGEYSLGELEQVEGNELKFKVVTPHGEHWSFEFIKDDRGKIVKCRFTDEDFPEMGSIMGVKVIK